MTKILYVPLDERACNYKYPNMLAQLTDDIQLVVPSKEMMGSFRTPANVDRLWDWILEHVGDCDFAIFSMDTLLYGNIVNSRLHHRTIEECNLYFNHLKKVKEINPTIQIHAINLIARVANYNNNSEDPIYWSTYGTRIWKYCYLLDKMDRQQATGEEMEEFKQLVHEIPVDDLSDFLERRKINSYVNFMCLDFVAEGIVDHLVIPKDDTAEYGYAALTQRKIAKVIWEKKIVDKVMIYPGADEVGVVLFSRIFNLIKGYTPAIYIRYSSVNGQYIIPKYEDRPLHEGLKSQITSIGGIIVESAAESDFLFAIHSPGTKMIECSEQKHKDVTYYSYSNMNEFLNYIAYYKQKYEKPYAIADVAFCNGSDNELMLLVEKKGILKEITSYSGWNTTQNTIGLALGLINICSYYNGFPMDSNKKLDAKKYLLTQLIESWLFEAKMFNIMQYLMENKIDPYHLEDKEEEVISIVLGNLQKEIDSELNHQIDGINRVKIKDLKLPWHRVFDIDFDLSIDSYY